MKKLLILILILLCKPAFSQEYNYTNYTPNDGLPSSEVYHVIQDSKGYIWFATDNGVSRFDGYEFKNFTTEDGLPDNTIFEIYEDFKGKLWFISFSGKLSYYFRGKISLYEFNDSLSKCFSLDPKPIKRGFYIDRQENLYWCDFYNDITRISKYGETSTIKGSPQLFVVDNHVLINDHASRISDSVLIQYNNQKYNSGINLNGISHWQKYKIAIKKDDVVFFSTRNNLFRIVNNLCEQEIEVPGVIIWLNYQNNILWVGTSIGLMGFENGNILKTPKYHILKNKNTSSVLIDKENSLWITTLNNGVYRISNLSVESVFNKIDDSVASLGNGFNGILIGLNNGTIAEYYKNEIKFIPEFKQEKSTLRITKIHQISKNTIYITTKGKSYILKYSHKKKQFIITKIFHNDLDIIIPNIIIDSSNIIWASASRFLLQSTNGFDFKNINPTKTPNKSVNSIMELDKDKILIGANDGLWVYNKVTDSYFYLGQDYPEFSDRINALAYNHMNKSICIGTKTHGAYLLKSDSIIKINFPNSTIGNYISCIQNHKNEFWLGTKGGGAYRIIEDLKTPGKYNIQVYSSSQGVLSNEINDILINDSLVFIATNKGLNSINYKEFKPNLSSPPIYIENFAIINIDTSIHHSYVLSYKENSVNITLTGLAYKLNGRVKYKYRLSSSAKDTNWIYTSNRNIQLSYIPPGSYTFQAKAINENNIESKTPVEIKIKINPPFWKTWWFITILVLIFVLIASIILYAVYKMRIREINKRNMLEKEFIENKNKLQQEIEKFRQQALSQQMNPHFIFNSLNSIQYFIYQNEKTLSNKYLTKFSRLIRIILENSQHQLIPIQDELNALQLYLELEEMRLQGKLSFSIEVDTNINTEFYTIPPLLIQPFAENAIWHGIVNKKENGLLIIKLFEKANHFICIVEDNGIGREAAKEIQKRKQKTHKSLGANITERRLELLNSTYAEKNKIIFTDLMKNGVPSGTKVEIKIPKITVNPVKEI